MLLAATATLESRVMWSGEEGRADTDADDTGGSTCEDNGAAEGAAADVDAAAAVAVAVADEGTCSLVTLLTSSAVDG